MQCVLAKWCCADISTYDRINPRVSCQIGIALDDVLDDVLLQNVRRWATRKCYPYVGRPATGECSTINKTCANALPSSELHLCCIASTGYTIIMHYTAYTDLCI
jgi:hypothetical protein